MAVRRKNNKKMSRAGKIVLAFFALVLLLLSLTVGVGLLNASIVRIRRADVVLPDLPSSFDGKTLLYATDIDLCGLNTAEKSGKLFEQLQSLKPDMLLLGGDYTSSSLLETLNRGDRNDSDSATQLKKRTSFFYYISAFDAPMGKYAIASPEDPDWNDLSSTSEACGVHPLINDRAAIRIGNDTLWLVGISRESANLNSAGNAFSKDDCVISIAYSPSVLPILLTSEAADGGQWTDLALCGHTHGGQIRLFGRSVLNLDSREQRFLSGWRMDSGFPILVSQGIGCEGVNVRLGSQPEVWFITLRRC